MMVRTQLWILLTVAFVCDANTSNGHATTTPPHIQEAVDYDDGFLDKTTKHVYIVDKSPINDPDYIKFVHGILKAGQRSDGQVYVKVAGEQLQLVDGNKGLDDIHLVGSRTSIFRDIAEVLLIENERWHIVVLVKNMSSGEDGVDTVMALLHTRQTRIDVLMIESKEANLGTRSKRQTTLKGLDIYQAIAQISGGYMVQTTKNSILTVANLLKQAIKSHSVDIMRFKYPGSKVGHHFNVPVDETMTQMTLMLETPTSLPVVMLLRPSGLPVPPNAQQVLGNNLALFEMNITAPSDIGQWKVPKLGSSDWDVTVTGQSPVDFSFEFMDHGPSGNDMFPITGRPIAGKTYQIMIKVSHFDQIKSVNIVMLLDNHNMPAGMPQILHDVSGRRGKSVYTVNMTIPTVDFKVAIDGMDKRKQQVRRLSPILISPISVDLLISPMNGVIFANESLSIPFTVMNEASKQQEIIIRLEDDKRFSQNPALLAYTLKGGENRTGHFTIKAGTLTRITSTVIITAKPYIRGQVTKGQFAIRRFTVQERTTTSSTTTTPTMTTQPPLAPGKVATQVSHVTTGLPSTTTAHTMITQQAATSVNVASKVSPVTTDLPSMTTTQTMTTQQPATSVNVASKTNLPSQLKSTAQSSTLSSPATLTNGSGLHVASGSVSSKVAGKGAKDQTSLIQRLRGLHGYLHLLQKFNDTELEMEIIY